MMRYINMDNQVNADERRFAFWDTVRDRFVDINGDQSWHSVVELDQSFEAQLRDDDTSYADFSAIEALRERLVGLARGNGALEETPNTEGCWFVYGDEDDDDAPYHDRLNAIERQYGVTIEISDVSGTTLVYAYTADGDRLCFEFNSMNPDVEDVETVAAGIATLKRVSDKRPAAGKMAREP